MYLSLLLILGRQNMDKKAILNTKSTLGNRKKFYLIYTALFAMLSVCVFSFMLFMGRSLVWKSDGYMQHLKALTYYGQWLRQLARNLLYEHQLLLPEFNFSMGLGSDVVTTLHYYVVGDPLNLFAAVVPSDYTVYLYNALLLVRLYFSGLCFSLYCFNKGLKNQFGILAGAFVYAFCGFSLMAIRHPYFINPLIHLPLLLMGVDQVLAKRRLYLLIVVVGVVTVSNFYFLYMLGVLTVIYVFGQLISQYRHAWKQAWKPLFQLIGCAVLGIALGAGILLPVLKSFLSDSRVGVEPASLPWYSPAYYSNFPGGFLSSYSVGAWTCGGFSPIAILAVFFLFMKRKQWTLTKIFLVLTTVGLLFPLVGKAFNGFSYPTNRWSFVLAFLVGFALAAVWPQLITLTKKDAFVLCSCLSIYAAFCFAIERSRRVYVFVPIVIAFVCLMLMMFFAENSSAKSKKLCQTALLVLTMFGVFVNAFWLYSVHGKNYAAEFLDYQTIQNGHECAPDDLVKSVSKKSNDKTFFRYSGRSLPRNTALLQRTNCVQYYWSLSNPYVADFHGELSLRNSMPQLWDGLDDRSALLTLASSRYYVTPASSTASLPYGVKKITVKDINKPIVNAALEAQTAELGRKLTENETAVLEKRLQNKYVVYENPYALPLGYTYSSYITRQKFDELEPLAKQEAMLQTAVLEDIPSQSLPQNEALSITGIEVPYTVHTKSNQVTLQDHAFVVTQANAAVELQLEGAVAGETYVCVEGLTYAGTSAYQLYNEDTSIDPLHLYTKTIYDTLTSTQKQSLLRADQFYVEPTEIPLKLQGTYTNNQKSIAKNLQYYTPYYQWYNNRHDFDINLGYYKNAPKSVTITFPNIGVYSFDSLSVICQPMTNYAEQINALKADVLKKVSVKNDVVTGKIALDTEKLLCLSIPYSEGWTAYVNNEPAELVRTNTMYMGLVLPAGEHRIRLVYRTPGLRLGLAVSAAALAVFVGLVLVQEIPTRIKRKEAKDV